MSEDAATVVCVLGMHRSATSLTSRLLNLLGVQLGPREAISNVGADNPKGYWEHRPLVQIDDEILETFGGRWDEPPTFPPFWTRDPRLVELAAKARATLGADFGAEPLWGWKDPRACLTLPFWQELIGPMRYVLCVRNPCEVVASLGARDGMSAEKASRLWLAHVQASLAHTSGQPRILIFFEDLVADLPGQLRRLARFIGCAERAESPEVQQAAAEFLAQELRHHRMSLEELAGDSRLLFPIKALYFTLRLHGSGRSLPGAERAIDVLASHAVDAWESEANGSDDPLLKLRIAHLEGELRAALLDRDRRAREADVHLHALREIRASTAWRVVGRARRQLSALLPDGTLRRRTFRALLRVLAAGRSVSPALADRGPA